MIGATKIRRLDTEMNDAAKIRRLDTGEVAFISLTGKKQDNVRKFVCNICDMKFHTIDSLRTHRVIHKDKSTATSPVKGVVTRPGMMQCMRIGRAFVKLEAPQGSSDTADGDADDLTSTDGEDKKKSIKPDPDAANHTNLNHCETCKIYFSTPDRLNSHNTSRHGKSTKFPCDQCKLKFTRLDALTTHRRTDHAPVAVEPADSQPEEGKTFHEKCQLCDQEQVDQDGWLQHMHLNHAIQGHESSDCKVCHIGFDSPDLLKSHNDQNHPRIGDENFVKSATGAKKAADKVVMPSDKEVKKPAQSKPSVYDIPVTSEYVTIREGNSYMDELNDIRLNISHLHGGPGFGHGQQPAAGSAAGSKKRVIFIQSGSVAGQVVQSTAAAGKVVQSSAAAGQITQSAAAAVGGQVIKTTATAAELLQAAAAARGQLALPPQEKKSTIMGTEEVVKRKDVSKTFQALRALKAAKTGRSSLSTTKTDVVQVQGNEHVTTKQSSLPAKEEGKEAVEVLATIVGSAPTVQASTATIPEQAKVIALAPAKAQTTIQLSTKPVTAPANVPSTAPSRVQATVIPAHAQTTVNGSTPIRLQTIGSTPPTKGKMMRRLMQGPGGRLILVPYKGSTPKTS